MVDQRRVTRRSLLTLLGGAGLVSVAAACTRKLRAITGPGPPTNAPTSGASGTGAAPSCILTREATEGPFYLPLDLVREDITEGRPSLPLELRLQVVDATACSPIKGAAVDIWHADASGVYSGVVPLGPSSNATSTSGTFMRGVQMTGADGTATFTTIYPGWYMGRAVHIHVKVHVGGQTVHTGQLFFPDDLTARVFQTTDPYRARSTPDTTNETDGIFQQAGSNSAILVMAKTGTGYSGSMTMGVRA